MTVKAYRITTSKRSTTAFTGEGAAKVGGRWNSVRSKVVYTSSSLSLAMLEMLVHLSDYATLEKSYVFIPVEIPGGLIDTVDTESLPIGWDSGTILGATQRIGDDWLAKGTSAVLAVPSAVVPYELNYVINPQHLDFPKISIGTPQSLVFDSRLSK